MNPSVTTELLAALGAASARACVLCVIVAIFVTLLGRRLAPRWRCALWFLVFLRLAWPFHISSPVSLFGFFELFHDAGSSDAELSRLAGYLHPAALGTTSSTVLFVWRLIASLFAVRLFAGSAWNAWRLRSARPLTSWEVWWLFQQSKEACGLRGPVAIYESAKVSSPCLVGFFSPRIVLPKNMLKDLSIEEVRLVFLHELAHLKRGDLWLGWIFEGLRSLHWFNPAVWYACRRFYEDREEACDAVALSVTPGSNRTYGRLLLRFMSGTPNGLALLNTASFTDGAATPPELLIRRIRAIASFQPGGRSWCLGLSLMIFLVCVGFTEPKVAPEACTCPVHACTGMAP